jgi:hypothetical protein
MAHWRYPCRRARGASRQPCPYGPSDLECDLGLRYCADQAKRQSRNVFAHMFMAFCGSVQSTNNGWSRSQLEPLSPHDPFTLQEGLSSEPRCEGMGTTVSPRLSLPCNSQPARPQINARTQCAFRILLTSFVSTDSSFSCPRNPLATTENPDGRSARGRTSSRDLSKSLISMSALPGLHEGHNPALLLLAGAPTGGQTDQMQVPALLSSLATGSHLILNFQAPSLTIRPHPSTKPWLQQGMLHHSHQPNPPLPTRLFQMPTSRPPSSYPPYPAPESARSCPHSS